MMGSPIEVSLREVSSALIDYVSAFRVSIGRTGLEVGSTFDFGRYKAELCEILSW